MPKGKKPTNIGILNESSDDESIISPQFEPPLSSAAITQKELEASEAERQQKAEKEQLGQLAVAAKAAALETTATALDTDFVSSPVFVAAAAQIGYTCGIAYNEAIAIRDSYKNSSALLDQKKYHLLLQVTTDTKPENDPQNRYFGGIFLAKRILEAEDEIDLANVLATAVKNNQYPSLQIGKSLGQNPTEKESLDFVDAVIVKGMKTLYRISAPKVGFFSHDPANDIFGNDKTPKDLWIVLTELKKQHDVDTQKNKDTPTPSITTFETYETLYGAMNKIKEQIKEQQIIQTEEASAQETLTTEESASFTTIAGLFKSQMPVDPTPILQSLAVAAFGANLDGEERFDKQGRKEGVREILKKYIGNIDKDPKKIELFKKLISTPTTITISPNAKPDRMVRPHQLSELLDESGKVQNSRPEEPGEFTRTATVLEFAMRCNDEEMTKIIKEMMDEVARADTTDPEWSSTEFNKQFNNVFGDNYGCNPDGTPEENNGFLKTQENQAKQLFIDADIAVLTDTDTDIDIGIKASLPITQEKVNKFKRLLSDYIQNADTDKEQSELSRLARLAHNPYILQIAHEIYEALPCDGSNAYYNQLYLFLEQNIGEIQNSMKKTSHLWLKHTAEGIYNRAEKIPPAESPAPTTPIPPCSRSFALQYPKGLDVRSISSLGGGEFVDIFGWLARCRAMDRGGAIAWCGVVLVYYKIMSNKNITFSTLTQPVQSQHTLRH